ncbi:MAG: hypothetical protein RMJ81_00610 [Candidatus Kryptonium sp.]|nr:hypothetical protein [Candidatus Kryptonium sp.]MCX7762653.1 hypothetical protein [Candidatus Kryptonium sp.]MDW8108139.1 hypothetical protein [Candidatus Kryptonium sp.]
MKKIIFFTVFVILHLNFACSGAFKDLGNGARAVALGLTYVAIADNPYAMFYNPSGIGQIKRLSFASSYSRLYPFVQGENLYYLTFSGVLPVFSLFDFGVGVSYFKTGMWNENQFVFSIAREFKYIKGLSLGGNLKILRWSAVAPIGESGYSYFGFTFDAGAIFVWRDFINGSDFRFGLTARNITQPSIAVNKSRDAKLPLEIAGGVVYVSRTYNYQIGLGALRSGDELKVDVGFEIQAISAEFLRSNFEFVIRASGGTIINGGKQSSLNPGFGIRYWKFRIDYVYVHQFEISDAGGSHKFSIEFNL